MGMSIKSRDPRDEGFSCGYGNWTMLCNEIADRCENDKIYKLNHPIRSDEGGLCMWDKEDARDIYEAMDTFQFLYTFPKSFRKWIVDGRLEGDRPSNIDEMDEYLWDRFLAIKNVFSYGTEVIGG